MRKLLRYLTAILFLLAVGGVNSYADEVSIDLTSQGYKNAGDVTTVTSGLITLTFDAGTNSNNSPKYYTSDNTVRLYSNNSLTIASSSGTITNVSITSISKGNIDKLSAGSGTYSTSGTTGTWVGNSASVVFTASATVKLTKIVITYSSNGTSDPSVTIGSETLTVGGTTTVSYPDALTDMEITSSDASIASVSGNTITGVSAGTATITATWSATDNYNAGTKIFNIAVTSEKGWYYEFTSKNLSKGGDSYTFNGTENGNTVSKVWAYTPTWKTSTEFNNGSLQNDGSLQLCSAKAPLSSAVFSSSDFAGTITKIVVNASTAKSATATIGVTIGGVAFGEVQDLSTTATDYTFTGNMSGDIAITLSQTTSKALYIKSINVYYTSLTTIVTAPTITLATGSFTENQTVTITNNYEGATVYYTTNGSDPSASNGTKLESTANGATATVSVSKTTTIKAIAIADVDGKTTPSAITSKTITITHKVETPEFTGTSDKKLTNATGDVNVTCATSGATIYYTTGKTPVRNSDGTLSASAVSTNGSLNFKLTTDIHAIARDADGCLSDTAYVRFVYIGAVELPYNETFQESFGNFETSNSGTTPPEWTIHSNTGDDAIDRWGEERTYAYVKGSSKVGTANLVSPAINIKDCKTLQVNFSHAGHYFAYTSNSAGSSTAEKTKEVAEKYCKLYYVPVTQNADGTFTTPEKSNWVQLTIPKWFAERRVYDSSTKKFTNKYDRTNAGDIDFGEGKTYELPNADYIRLIFEYTADADGTLVDKDNKITGTWNVIQLYVRGTKDASQSVDYEDVPTITKNGLYTYVTGTAIDWNKTLNNNEKSGNDHIKAYKIIKFNTKKAVLVQLGRNADNPYTPKDGMTDAQKQEAREKSSEDATIAETPVVLQVTDATDIDNGIHLVVAKTDDQPSTAQGNKLIGVTAASGVTIKEGDTFFVMHPKSSGSTSTALSDYQWNPLKAGRIIPKGKAYLNSTSKYTGEISDDEGYPAKGIFTSFEDLVDYANQNATGITDINAEPKQPVGRHDNTFYNLQGMKVEHPTHGIYIYNGRKIIIK